MLQMEGVVLAEATAEFETERTRMFRAGQLNDREVRAITAVETFGCQIIHVKRSDIGQPGWSYSIGVHDTCGKAEIIVVGLSQDTAHFLLNEAANRMRAGIDLAKGRHAGMVGEVDCEFRPVDPKWVNHLMGWALWYYQPSEFPVLQAIYPDLENRFPNEPEFDTSFQQPFLQSGAAMTRVEEDLWASADPNSSLFDWRFPDPPDTRVFLSRAIHTGREPVTYVSHDESDGAWQFLGPSMAGDELPVLSCFHHPIDSDPTLKELADLPRGWYAERAKTGEPWFRYQHEPEPGE